MINNYQNNSNLKVTIFHSYQILVMLIKKKRVIMFEVMGDSAVLVY
jgi:hypothetical protein